MVAGAPAPKMACNFAGAYRPRVLEMPGLIECGLLRAADQPARYVMLFRWETADQATAWRTSDVHQRLQPALNELHTGMEVAAYERVA